MAEAFDFRLVEHFAAFVVVENPLGEPDLHLFRKLQRPVAVEEPGSPLRRMAERVVVGYAARRRGTVVRFRLVSPSFRCSHRRIFGAQAPFGQASEFLSKRMAPSGRRRLRSRTFRRAARRRIVTASADPCPVSGRPHDTATLARACSGGFRARASSSASASFPEACPCPEKPSETARRPADGGNRRGGARPLVVDASDPR